MTKYVKREVDTVRESDGSMGWIEDFSYMNLIREQGNLQRKIKKQAKKGQWGRLFKSVSRLEIIEERLDEMEDEELDEIIEYEIIE